MRNSLRRALALATSTPVLAGTLLAAPAAAQGLAPTCGPGSTVLVDFTTLGGLHTNVSSYDVSDTVKNVCVELFGVVQTVLVVKTGAAVTPPSVTRTNGTGTCAQRIVDMTAPIALSLSVGASTSGPSICLGQDGVTTTISFGAPSVQSLPDVDAYTLRYTFLNDYVACAVPYARYHADATYYAAWDNCRQSDHRVA